MENCYLKKKKKRGERRRSPALENQNKKPHRTDTLASPISEKTTDKIVRDREGKGRGRRIIHNSRHKVNPYLR